MASFSDGTFYVNALLAPGGVFNTDFSPFLTQVWDFADFGNNLDPVIAKTVPVRTYLDPDSDKTSKPGQTLIDLPVASWTNYAAARSGLPKEVPPLPGQDPTIKAETHHEIRDFMLLDAAVNRIFSNSTSFSGTPADIVVQGVICQLNRVNLGPVTATEDASTPQVSQGTGLNTTSGKLVVKETTVTDFGTLDFRQNDVKITLLLYELQDTGGNIVDAVPNWFGVAVPSGVTDFSKPILYFHPTPSQNNYIDGKKDVNYFKKTAAGPWTGSGRDWRELFAYMDRNGNQLAGAILQGAISNQIVITPIMTTHSATTTGILKDNWLAIVTDILQDVSTISSSSSSSS